MPYRTTAMYWAMLAGTVALGLLAAGDGLADLWQRWSTEEAYSHGFLIPPIAVYLLWRRRAEIAAEPFRPSWAGVVLAAGTLAVYAVAQIAEIYTLIQYTLLTLLFGIALAVMGWRAARFAIAPLVLLLFAIPLPYTLQVELTSGLQLLSSQLGVLGIRALGVPVNLEGNVIDLGVYQLQVVEACSGLNYLYPLLGIAFICAALFEGPLWKRVVIVLAAIPITIAMNSLRIASVGLLVREYGAAVAEGFVHDFQGWAVFLASTAVLVAVMWAIARLGRHGRPLLDSLDLDIDFTGQSSTDSRTPADARPLPRTLPVIGVLVLGALVTATVLGNRAEEVPARTSFALFPMLIDSWVGQRGAITSNEIQTLQLDDYLLAQYRSPQHERPVELYSAYYQSQRSGTTPHSPKVCLPGGGWEIAEFDRRSTTLSGLAELHYNRSVMRKGSQQLLVYYWFQQRGRTFANEYLMKWYLFRDGLLQNRTDGSLVRLTTPITGTSAAAVADAERRIEEFVLEAAPVLPRFIPE